MRQIIANYEVVNPFFKYFLPIKKNGKTLNSKINNSNDTHINSRAKQNQDS